tara:strand:- start:186 stop:536 length:351 start_codon:yes stop_codon:yes gene_type:complete
LTIPEVIGLITIKTVKPQRNDKPAINVIILAFEYPKTFSVSNSLFCFIEIKNHIAEIKIMKGIKLIKIKFGIYDNVKIIGRNKLSPEFLKNSTSSNKFKIKPKQKEIKIALNKTLE